VPGLRQDQFPVTERWAWFNHATYSPPPRRAAEAVARWVTAMSRGDLPEGSWAEILERTRAKAGRLVGCQPDDLALLKSTAEGVGVVALGLDWNSGDQVIVYDQEFPAGAYPWLNLGHLGVEVRLIRDGGRNRFEVEDVEALMTPRTRVVCLGLVNFGNGFRAPVEAVGRLCRDRGVLLVVDATQALGALQVDVRRLGCDVLVAHGYKFMMAGYGTALSYFSPSIRGRLRVPEPGWKSLREERGLAAVPENGLDFAEEARRFEPGVPDVASIVATESCIDLFGELGPAAIEERILGYGAEVASAVAARGYRVVSSTREGERSGIISLAGDGIDPAAVQRRLAERNVACAIRDGRIRLAVHFYNDAGDLERLIECLPDEVDASGAPTTG
jgi:cysteine desulfurase / selenocysteine lyase